jgi:hypothetical protein
VNTAHAGQFCKNGHSKQENIKKQVISTTQKNSIVCQYFSCVFSHVTNTFHGKMRVKDK